MHSKNIQLQINLDSLQEYSLHLSLRQPPDDEQFVPYFWADFAIFLNAASFHKLEILLLLGVAIYDGIMDTSNVVGDVAETATSAAGAFANELKKMGQTAFSQMLGTHTTDQIPNKDELAKMAKKDEKFSIEEQAKIQAKIKAIYEEFEAMKKKKQQEQEAMEEVQEEETKKLEELNEERVKEQDLTVNPAIEKTKAEIKNYGAE